jgi:hypothetical protein
MAVRPPGLGAQPTPPVTADCDYVSHGEDLTIGSNFCQGLILEMQNAECKMQNAKCRMKERIEQMRNAASRNQMNFTEANEGNEEGGVPKMRNSRE